MKEMTPEASESINSSQPVKINRWEEEIPGRGTACVRHVTSSIASCLTVGILALAFI